MKKKSITESTEAGTENREKEGRGRPTKHTGRTKNLSVVFNEEVADQLRIKTVRMKKSEGGNFSMSEFIRPVIEAVLESDVDLSLADSEEELKELMLSKLL
jgi:hypothetical protein